MNSTYHMNHPLYWHHANATTYLHVSTADTIMMGHRMGSWKDMYVGHWFGSSHGVLGLQTSCKHRCPVFGSPKWPIGNDVCICALPETVCVRRILGTWNCGVVGWGAIGWNLSSRTFDSSPQMVGWSQEGKLGYQPSRRKELIEDQQVALKWAARQCLVVSVICAVR